MKDIFLLDLDETLLDFQRTERENFFMTLSAFGVTGTEGDFLRFHDINDGLWKLLERGGITRKRLTVQRFEMLFDEMQVSLPPKTVEEVAYTFYGNYQKICYPFPGSQEFVKTLSERGRVYLVTNGAKVIQDRHIEMAGLSPYLSGAFISEEIGHDKPQKEYADYVTGHIEGYDAARAVWVGDSLTSDRKCALVAGIDFVLYAARGIPEGYPDPAATTYGECLKLLESM